MHQKKYFIGFILILTFMVGLSFTARAAFVSPTKVYIQSGQTTATISILNRSNEPRVYTFQWERRVRSKNGKNVNILKEGETSPGYRPADPYVIFSPRRIVVQAGDSQRVRLLARRKGDMEPGEYRSHLLIMSDAFVGPEKPEVGAGGVAGVMSIRPAVSIPIMLRTGETYANIDVTHSRMDTMGESAVVYVDFVNQSNRSIYGDSIFKCTPQGSDNAISAKTNGFRLYYEVEAQKEWFVIPEDLDISKCASLDLEFYETDRPIGRQKPLAAISLR